MLTKRSAPGRGHPAWSMLLGMALLLAAVRPAVPAPARPGIVRSVESVSMSVADLERAVSFYVDVLTFQEVDAAEVAGPDYEHLFGVFGMRMRVARLRLGEEVIELREYLAPRGRAIPEGARSNDLWFQHIAIIVRDMDAAYARLRAHRVEHASPGPQRLPDWNPAAGGIEAFYFRDPDGHPLEILRFPADKGDARWHRAGDDLFLGIDHTAVVVSDTEESLRFYRDLLGLRIAGSSENFGPEQERLNNVFGARLRITSLRAASGPGVELLEYLAPGDGRSTPAGRRDCDLVSTETVLRVPDAEAAARQAREQGFAWVSAGAVATPGRELGAAGGVLLRDPDGHLVRLMELP